MMAFASLGSYNKKFMATQRRQAVRLTGILGIVVIGMVCLSGKHCIYCVITLAVQVPFLDQLFTLGRSSGRWVAQTPPGS